MSHVATCPSVEIMYSREKALWDGMNVMFAAEEGHVANDRVQHELTGGRGGGETTCQLLRTLMEKNK